MYNKVMVVDDSLTVRQILSLSLSDAGYHVTEACDGMEAARMLTEDNFDMLFTDLNMPNMDGIELIRTVRKIPGYRFTPIIMLTAEDQEEKKLEGRNVGASGWLVKPFKTDQLLAIAHMVCPLKQP